MASLGGQGMVMAVKDLQRSLNTSIDQFVALASSSGADPVQLEKTQGNVHSIASDLVAKTTNPVNEMLQFAFMPALNAAVRTAIDLDLFSLTNTSVTVEEAAKKTEVDGVLMLRLMRALTANRFLDESPEGHFKSTALAQVLANPALRDWNKVHFDVSLKVYQNIPIYLVKTGYRNPGDIANGMTPTADTLGHDFFEYLQYHPTHFANFNSAMKLSEALPPATIPDYPFMHEIQVGARRTTDAVTLVDIGGGRGQFVEALIGTNPKLPGRFVVQDLQPVVDSLDKLSLGFEAMAHDFFTPQPIAGARWYHLRRVLHDWPDARCLTILQHTAHALKPGYSTLLITEFVLPDSGIGQQEALVDLNMMILNGMERSETQWQALLAVAGFAIKKLWRAEVGSLATIEAELL